MDANLGIECANIFNVAPQTSEITFTSSTLSLSPFVQPSSTFTITPSDLVEAMVVFVNDVNSPVSITLPASPRDGQLYFLKKTTSSTTSSITISVDGGTATIDGQTSLDIGTDAYLHYGVVAQGGNYWVI